MAGDARNELILLLDAVISGDAEHEFPPNPEIIEAADELLANPDVVLRALGFPGLASLREANDRIVQDRRDLG